MDKQGNPREYFSAYLRRTYREGQRVRNETVANLSALPAHVVDWIDAGLKGEQLVAAGSEVTIARSLPHGHVAAVAAMAHQLGVPALLGPACRARDLVLALIVSRVVRPASKLATAAWWPDVTLESISMSPRRGHRRDLRRDGLAAAAPRRHRNPARRQPPGARREPGSDGVVRPDLGVGDRAVLRAGRARLLPRRQERLRADRIRHPHRSGGRPVAVRVFPGNTADPDAFTDIVEVVRTRFGLTRLVLVGDRGMITTARIAALRELNDDPDTATDFGWITALRAPQVATLAADTGPLQMSLFDTQDLAEISHPDFPGERLIACRNPLLAAERTRKRHDLLAATEHLLEPIIARAAAGRLSGADKIGVAVGRVINKHKMAKHFHYTITDTSPTIQRRHHQIAAEAALDGIYLLPTTVPADQLDAAGVITGYKNLAHIERDFRIIKADDLDLRPIHHRLDDRVKAHVLICLLACYLVWHLRKAWAPMTFTDEHPPTRDNPVAPAQRPSIRRRQVLHRPRRPAQPTAQLPRPARSPGHPHPQPDPLHRHRHRNPHAHRPHPRPAPRLHPHRRPHPTDRRVVKQHHTTKHEPPAQPGKPPPTNP